MVDALTRLGAATTADGSTLPATEIITVRVRQADRGWRRLDPFSALGDV